jgi:hypothetical protein
VEVFLHVQARRPDWNEKFDVETIGAEVLGHASGIFYILSGFERMPAVEKVFEGTGYETVEVVDNVARKEKYRSSVKYRLTDGSRTLSLSICHPPGIMFGHMRWKVELSARYQTPNVDVVLYKDEVYVVNSDEAAVTYFCRILHQLIKNAEELSGLLSGRAKKFKGTAYVDSDGTFVTRSVSGNLLAFRRGLPGERIEFYRRIEP